MGARRWESKILRLISAQGWKQMKDGWNVRKESTSKEISNVEQDEAADDDR